MRNFVYGIVFAIAAVALLVAQGNYLPPTGNRALFLKGLNISANADTVANVQGVKFVSVALDTGLQGTDYDSILVILKNGSTAAKDTLWLGLQ